MKITNESCNINSRDPNWVSSYYIEGLFSVIIPSYNRAHTIIESLDSVWSQTYRPIEIVIVDDGSIDDTQQVIAKWIMRHSISEQFLCRYECQENAGVCAARNRALRKCRGQFIQFLDSDDTIFPQRLEKLANLFVKNACDYIETGFEGFVTENGFKRIISTHLGHTNSHHLKLLLEGRLWPNTLRAAYTRSLISSIGPWNEKMLAFEDYEYAIRALTRMPYPKVGAIFEPLASARRDGGKRGSDLLKTWKGRSQRVHCEEVLGQNITSREDIPDEWKKRFVARVYTLGLRCNARGWYDLGKRCKYLADSIPVKGKLRDNAKRTILGLDKLGVPIFKLVKRMVKGL